jgi:hypothetical protein
MGDRTSQVLNLDGQLTGEPLRFTFPEALKINTVRMSAFTSSSPPVPISGTFEIIATRNGTDLETFTANGNFMTIEDVLANGMGKKKVSIIHRDKFDIITYEHSDDRLADLDVDAALGSRFGVVANANGRCTITTSPWNTCNLRKEPYVEPVALVYIDNTYKKGNTRPVRVKDRIVNKFLLGTIAVTPGQPVSYKPDIDEEFELGESKAELLISVLWQNDTPFLTETSAFYMQLIYS